MTYKDDDSDDDFVDTYLRQWEDQGDGSFRGIGKTKKDLPPGLYKILVTNQGIFFSRQNTSTNELIRFENSSVDEVMTEIDKFWCSREKYKKFDVQYKRGVLLVGPPGCHPAGTKVIMYDGSTKRVEDIVVGDVLLGPDSEPRRVLELCRGQDEMYKITPVKGESFVVNGHHILHLRRSGKRDKPIPKILNVSVNEFLEMSKPSQIKYKLEKSGCVSFKQSDDSLLIDPYFLGVWLGDGTSSNQQITSMDSEIKDYLEKYAESLSLNFSTHKKRGNNRAKVYSIISAKKKPNKLLNFLREENLIDNKHIPHKYLTSSIESRLNLLAGIIDTDGCYSEVSWRASEKVNKKGYKGYFEIIQKNKKLTDDVVFLAKSLGFGVTCKKSIKTIKSLNFSGEYYRISIFGDIHRIPTKLPRKIACFGKPNKNPLLTGIKSITKIKDDNYYGFTLSSDHLYMTDDFIIHHNSGKSSLIKMLINDVINRGGIAVDFEDSGSFKSGVSIIRKIHPSKPIVCIMEDIESIMKQNSPSSILNVLDGSTSFLDNIIFVATSNYPEQLEERIKDRPSRFDRVIEIGLPGPKMRESYLRHLFKNAKQSARPIKKWVKDTDGLTFPHLKELFLSVNLYENEYDIALDKVRNMSKALSSESHRKKGFALGFDDMLAEVEDSIESLLDEESYD